MKDGVHTGPSRDAWCGGRGGAGSQVAMPKRCGWRLPVLSRRVRRPRRRNWRGAAGRGVGDAGARSVGVGGGVRDRRWRGECGDRDGEPVFGEAPTAYRVESSGVSYWANCVWRCAGDRGVFWGGTREALCVGRSLVRGGAASGEGPRVFLCRRGGELLGGCVVHLSDKPASGRRRMRRTVDGARSGARGSDDDRAGAGLGAGVGTGARLRGWRRCNVKETNALFESVGLRGEFGRVG